MSRTVLVIGGLVVVAAAVALVLLLGGGDGASAGGASSAPSERSPSASSPSAGAPSAPSLSGGAPTFAPAGEGQPREYVVGDVRVRDHRSGDHAPLDIPPNVHPAEGRALPSSLVHEVSQKVKAVMIECMADVPRDARAGRPRLEGQIIVAIRAKQVRIDKALIHLRELTGPAAETAKACVESRSVGLEHPAGEEADLDAYSINLSYAIP